MIAWGKPMRSGGAPRGGKALAGRIAPGRLLAGWLRRAIPSTAWRRIIVRNCQRLVHVTGNQIGPPAVGHESGTSSRRG